MNKFILVDKPKSWTSFDAVAYVRRIARNNLQQKNTCPVKSGETGSPLAKFNRVKVGHAGTLDPFATGLLIIGVGRQATKQLDKIKNLAKTYEAVIRLGATSDTDDCTGVITPYSVIPTEAKGRAEGSLGMARNDKPNILQIKKILKTFTGEQEQIPPMYSAKSIGGQRLYKLARQGKVVDRPASKIKIYKIKLLDYKWPNLSLEVKCSSGTYIRTLAHDIGEALGVGGYCLELRRTKIGNYSIKRAQKLKD